MALLLTGAIMLLVAVITATLAWRLGSRPGVARPTKIDRRGWLFVAAMLAAVFLALAWLTWAIGHHHGALGVLVLTGAYMLLNVLPLGLRYRRHKRRSSK